MSRLKVIGFVLATLVVGSVIVSCKAHHELCPAYSKGVVVEAEQAY